MSDILHHPSTPVTVAIDGSERTYRVRVPTVMDRAIYDREVRRAGGRQWTTVQLLDALEEAAREILAEQADVRERMLGEIDDVRALVAIFSARLSAGELADRTALLAAADEMNRRTPFFVMWERRLGDQHQPLQDMMSDNGSFERIAAAIACRMFLVGWNADVPFVRTRDGVPDAILSGIPSRHVEAIYRRVAALLEPTEAMGNSSGSPSGRPSDPAPSATDSADPTTATSPMSSGSS